MAELPRPEDRLPHPAPCNWSGGGLCVCDTTHEQRMDVRAEREAETERAWGATGFVVEADEPPSAEGWRIRDLDELNRVLGRMARLERLREENRELVAKEVARKQEWLAKEDEALARRYRDLAAHVEVYARDNRESLGKTRRLPNGTVAWRERKEGAYRLDPKMTDHAARKALLEWARTPGMPPVLRKPGPEVVDVERVKDFLDHMASGAAARLTPPGLEWVGPGESLSIVVKEKP